jgi:DNA invertase Pin-like site-specific DNA recombinase
MIYGYARVSTTGQKLDRQIDALMNQGCDYVYSEKTTGTKKDRPELSKMINNLKDNDVIIICDLTRLSRSTQDLLSLVEQIKEKKAYIRSLKDSWLDTTDDNAQSMLLLGIMSCLAQFERDCIVQRVNEGIASARSRGVVGGRPRKNRNKVDLAIQLKEQGKTAREIEELTGVSSSTLYRRLRGE